MLSKIKQHKLTKHTVTVISWKLKIVIFLILPFVIFTLLTSNTDYIKGVRSFVVLSGSMEPTIPVGSVIYSQKQASYTKGDIISFTNQQGQIVTHRIASVKQAEQEILYQTKGDANRNADAEFITSAKIIGKVFFTIPYVGRAIMFVKTPTGFILSVVIPSIIFIFWELWNIKREIEKEVEKRVMGKIHTKGTE
jgi:signal peptidase